jgi:hypothetical protein
VPFVLIQIVMVGLVILFPQMVMVYKDDAPTVDPSKIQIMVPQDTPPTGADGQPAPEPTEQQKSDTEDESAKSLQDAFKATTPAPPAPGGAAPPK